MAAADRDTGRIRITIEIEAPLAEELAMIAAYEGMTRPDWIRYVLRADTDRRDRLAAAKAGVSV